VGLNDQRIPAFRIGSKSVTEYRGTSSASSDWSFHSTPWEKIFLEKVHCARRIIRIACPFIKLRNIRLMLATMQTQNDVPLRIELLTRLNVRDCRSYVHDISAMKLLLDNPLANSCDIYVRINNRLHAKLYIFDNAEAFVTSSNLTYAGFNRNLEIALASTRPEVLSATVDHFQILFRNGSPLTHDVLSDVATRHRTALPTTIEWDEPPAERVDTSDELAELALDEDAQTSQRAACWGVPCKKPSPQRQGWNWADLSRPYLVDKVQPAVDTIVDNLPR